MPPDRYSVDRPIQTRYNAIAPRAREATESRLRSDPAVGPPGAAAEVADAPVATVARAAATGWARSRGSAVVTVNSRTRRPRWSEVSSPGEPWPVERGWWSRGRGRVAGGAMVGGVVAGGAVAGGAVAGGAVAGGAVAGVVAGVAVCGWTVARARRRTTNQVPATPWPLAWPALVSPLNRYRGSPLKVTCRLPPGRTIVPSADRGTPAPAASRLPDGTVNGGHAAAQAPVQVVLPVPSGVNR